MAGQITLQCSTVNSGTTVTLPGAVVTYNWGNLTNSIPIPGKFDIAEVDVGGFENPKIKINGVIDVGDIASNSLSQTHLRNFAKVQFDGTTSTAIKLTVASGGSGTDVYLKDSTDTDDFIYVIVESFDITFNSNVSGERKWNYNVNLIETDVS